MWKFLATHAYAVYLLHAYVLTFALSVLILMVQAATNTYILFPWVRDVCFLFFSFNSLKKNMYMRVNLIV